MSIPSTSSSRPLAVSSLRHGSVGLQQRPAARHSRVVRHAAETYSRDLTPAPRLIQHKAEAFWFYRFLSIVYDTIVNPGHWTEDMREDALEPAKLDDASLKVKNAGIGPAIGGISDGFAANTQPAQYHAWLVGCTAAGSCYYHAALWISDFQLPTDLQVVDVGGGTGFCTLGIVKSIKPENVTLIDQSPHQLEKARQKPALKGVTIMEVREPMRVSIIHLWTMMRPCTHVRTVMPAYPCTRSRLPDMHACSMHARGTPLLPPTHTQCRMSIAVRPGWAHSTRGHELFPHAPGLHKPYSLSSVHHCTRRCRAQWTHASAASRPPCRAMQRTSLLQPTPSTATCRLAASSTGQSRRGASRWAACACMCGLARFCVWADGARG